MKALACIVLGVIIAAFSGDHLLTARAEHASGQAAIWFVGIVLGLVIGFYGLVSNHRSHTRR